MVKHLVRKMTDGLLNSRTLPFHNPQARDWVRELWVGVLERAVHDAFFQNDYKEAKEALVWLNKDNKDFKLVCGFAGYVSDYLYSHLYVKIKLREKFFENYKETRDAKEVEMRNKLLEDDQALPIEEQKYEKNKMMLKLLNTENEKLKKSKKYTLKYDKNNPVDMKRLEGHAIDECIMLLETNTIAEVIKVEQDNFEKEIKCLNIK